MAFLILTIIILQLIFAANRPVYGLAFLLAVKILIPDTVRSPIDMFSMNSLCSIILFSCWLCYLPYDRKYKRNIQNILGLSICIYIAFMVFVMVVTNYTPLSLQFKHVIQYIVLQFLPVLVSMSVIKTANDLDVIMKVFTLSFLICVIYGIICYTTSTPYAYNAWFESYFRSARGSNVENFTNVTFGGVTGRIVGTSTSDDWAFGQVISVVSMIMFMIYSYCKSRVNLLCTILCFVAVLLTVRRSPILSVMIFGFVLFLMGNSQFKWKVFLYGSLFIVLILVLIFWIPQLAAFKNILEASFFFWDDAVSKANEISGSSVSLRLYQLSYTIRHIADNPLFGNGFGAMYVKSHPGMFGWESIVFTTLFQTGWIGMLLLGILYWAFYRYSIEYGGMKSRRLSLAFIFGSLVFSITSDNIYPFYTYFGLVLLHKMACLGREKMKRLILLCEFVKMRF